MAKNVFSEELGITYPQHQAGAIKALFAWMTYAQDRGRTLDEGVNLGLLGALSEIPIGELYGAIKVASLIAGEELPQIIILRARARGVWLDFCDGGWYVSDEPIR
ncbi:hypothetical protein COY32_05910 [candidate division WWE3 bacterium CG_4_10_14_0_2_um_filter_41_14]|uniref:Uncharacterized protein n=1 Tax=candidate division WWE3 bacterium CG_4_10_14_0_2_um_filter_41_14 TaxID=1975072 RepID=A0A2M7TFV0_UNCKA|nr:MAG: hypothetical protein COY32_05910 [candidate division WWE3 bacterium CG_4_10_14_0_2_um_filter_41_14]